MNNEPTIEDGLKIAVWLLISCTVTVVLFVLILTCGCASSVVKNSSTTALLAPTPPMPPMPPGAPIPAASMLAMKQNLIITPSGFVRTTTYTWQCNAAGLYNTGLRGTNYLMEPFTNAPVIYDVVSGISNSFTMTTTDQQFFVIAFNTNLDTNL